MKNLLLILTMFMISGCAFRAESGLGWGLGAEVKVPGLVHAGLAHGEFDHHGYHYQWGPKCGCSEKTTTVGLWHKFERQKSEKIEGGTASYKKMHECFGLFPGMLEHHVDGDAWRDAWSLEIGLMLIFFDIRLGFNPTGILP